MAKTNTKTAKWRKPNLGTAIKETGKGLLYLEFSSHQIIALRPSPPRAWVKQAGWGAEQKTASWQGTSVLPGVTLGRLAREVVCAQLLAQGVPKHKRPYDLRLNGRAYHRRRRQNFERFLEAVPAPVVAELREPYPREDWRLFQLLMASERARERCLGGDRALVFALSHARFFAGKAGRRTVRFAERWLKRPSVEILDRLGFPRRKLMAKLLRKMPLSHVMPAMLYELRQSLVENPEHLDLFAHHACITRALVDMLKSPFLSRLQASFLNALEAELNPWGGSVGQQLLADAVALEDQLRVRHRPRFASPEQLVMHHDDLMFRARENSWSSQKPFPPCPIQLSGEDAANAKFLDCSQALVNEGEKMDHCLGTLRMHHDAAQRGDLVVFALYDHDDASWEERGTLALTRAGGLWTVHDAKGYANAPLPPKAQHLAARILNALRHDALSECWRSPLQLEGPVLDAIFADPPLPW